jgi:Protein of unknown function (DUF3148)
MSQEFPIGTKVRLTSLPSYVKTAEPKPMLRPPHVVQLGEEGIVVDRRPGNYWGVKFQQGTFLLDSQYLEAVASGADTAHLAASQDVASQDAASQQDTTQHVASQDAVT